MRATTLASLFLIAGCSGGDNTPTPDASSTLDLSGSVADMSTPPDMSIIVSGTKIVDGVVDVQGATDDNFVVYAEDSSGNVIVSDFTGKNPTTIDPYNSSAASNGSVPVYISGKVAFVWHDGDDSNNGPLAIWTQANGVKEITMTASAINAVASDDGKYAVYLDNVSGSFADLELVSTDGTNPKLLAKQIQTDPQVCYPAMFFVAGKFVVAHCGMPDDAGVSGATITAYDPASGVGNDLASDMNSFLAVDVQKTSVLAYTQNGNTGEVFNIMTMTQTPAKLNSFSDGFFGGDGQSLVYLTTTMSLDSAPVMGGAPTVLQAANVAFLDTFSEDRKAVVFSQGFDMGSGLIDLYLAPTDKAATPVTLVADQTGASGGIFGDGFTSDSTYAIYYSAVDANNLIGDLNVVPVAGGTPSKLGTKVWIAYAAGGAKVAYNDNWKAFGSTAGRADIEIVDASKGPTATLVASQADVDYVVSSDKKTLIYSTAADKSRTGMFAYSIP